MKPHKDTLVKLKRPFRSVTTRSAVTTRSVVTRSVSASSQERAPTYKDTVKFVPPVTGGYVVKVYDGDTITIASRLPYEESLLYRFSVRLDGINAPEMRADNEDELLIAQKAKQMLANLVMGKRVELVDVATEKYGRLLAYVFVYDDETSTEMNVNEWMLQQRLAVVYDGGTKHTPASWMEYHRSASPPASPPSL